MKDYTGFISHCTELLSCSDEYLVFNAYYWSWLELVAINWFKINRSLMITPCTSQQARSKYGRFNDLG